MQPNKVYDEVIEFIASSSPQNVIGFRPSEEGKARVADLIFREKTEGLSEDEKSELDHYLHVPITSMPSSFAYGALLGYVFIRSY